MKSIGANQNGIDKNISGFDVPIALFNFNRPDLTLRVFEVVKQIRPRQLLLVADGPRESRPNEIRLCAEVRAVFDGIDWECEVFKNFSNSNLGSFKRNSSGLNWVFDTVEEAIILEDDCVPALSFFPYCKELLSAYRDDTRVSVISGNNFGFPNKGNQVDSYFFSAYALTWGWASWRRVWREVDLSMSWWEIKSGREMLHKKFPKSAEWQFWHKLFESIRSGEVKNAWDYQLILSSLRHSQHCIIPQVNLVTNVGFGIEATHCDDAFSPLHAYPISELMFPLVHPENIQRIASIDHAIFRIRIMPSLWQRALRKLARTLKRTKRYII